ncbi:Maph121 [Matsumuraeses phaseoli granulovirus]|uniref:Maph121 n=1 Tax=Matsumuraeses phaseoli granulovirus TaxID=2760664 RepID=A0AAE7MLJ9_9BBAC|nr:Maph121 [Matsumuraeses phaseoli granulovirus]QOD40084.1 Maph121 [Matsumuraeses phaseoli granulovirus]
MSESDNEYQVVTRKRKPSQELNENANNQGDVSTKRKNRSSFKNLLSKTYKKKSMDGNPGTSTNPTFGGETVAINSTGNFNLQAQISATPSSIDVDMFIAPNRLYINKVPNLNFDNNLTLVQSTLNTYLLNIGINKNAYQMLQTYSGDRAVGYYYFARYLIVNKVANTPEVFKEIVHAMRKLYMTWLDQLTALYPLVVNLNGADPTKEIMTIVNSSVYTLIKYIMSVVDVNLPMEFYNLPLNEYVPAECREAFDKFDLFIEGQNETLTSLYNLKIFAFPKSVEKFYNNNKTTGSVQLNDVKLIASDHVNTVNKNLFVIDK